MKKKTSLLLFFVGLLFISDYSFAQMFSVGESNWRPQASSSYIRAGIGPAMFVYTGDPRFNPNASAPEFDNLALKVTLESPNIVLAFTLANNLTGLKANSLFDVEFTLSNKFTFVRGNSVQLGVPFQLYTSLISVVNERQFENFNQYNFAVGTGAFLNLRISDRITFGNEFNPGYGFSSSSSGFFGGGMLYMRGTSRLNFINLLWGRSLSIGYDFNYRSFDIEDEIYDFDFTSHLITLGISL